MNQTKSNPKMKAVVIGGSGFIGSHVADALTKEGHNVTIFDIKKSPYLQKNQKMVVGNILDEKAVKNVIKDQDIVYNFAAIADIDEARHKPVETARVNILGNIYILEACKQAKIKRFIYASSVYVFSKTGSFYRCSKQTCEEYIQEYNRQYGLEYTILRYGTLYGNRADERNSIYRYLKEALINRKIIYYGSPDSIRDYIHVSDAAQSSIDILDDKYRNETITLTGNQRIRIKELFQIIKEMLNKDIKIEYKPGANVDHYTITPYVFNPKMGRKLIRNYHIDMGHGLLECISEIYQKYYKD